MWASLRGLVGCLWLLILFSHRVLDALPCSENDFDLEHEHQSLSEMHFGKITCWLTSAINKNIVVGGIIRV